MGINVHRLDLHGGVDFDVKCDYCCRDCRGEFNYAVSDTGADVKILCPICVINLPAYWSSIPLQGGMFNDRKSE